MSRAEPSRLKKDETSGTQSHATKPRHVAIDSTEQIIRINGEVIRQSFVIDNHSSWMHNSFMSLFHLS